MKIRVSRTVVATTLALALSATASVSAFASGTTTSRHVASHRKAPKLTLHSANVAFKVEVARARVKFRAQLATAKTSAQRLAARADFRRAVSHATAELEFELRVLDTADATRRLTSTTRGTTGREFSPGSVEVP